MLPKPDISKPVFQHPDFHMEAVYTQMGLCPECHNPIGESEFRDDLSKKEYTISGLCQACQDAIFTEPDWLDDDHEYDED